MKVDEIKRLLKSESAHESEDSEDEETNNNAASHLQYGSAEYTHIDSNASNKSNRTSFSQRSESTLKIVDWLIDWLITYILLSLSLCL